MISIIIKSIKEDILKNTVFLLPLRLFIGLGWIRAGTEKIVSEQWISGEILNNYFIAQLSNGSIQISFYIQCIEQFFIPNVQSLIWIIVIGQLLAAVSIFFGIFCNFGLLGGLFMNLNFILAGSINPSAFYMIIQSVLFTANTGAIVGLDKIICRYIPYEICVAQINGKKPNPTIEKWSYFTLIIGSFCLAGIVFPYIKDFSPNAIHDQGMIIFILSILGGISTFIKYVSIIEKNKKE